MIGYGQPVGQPMAPVAPIQGQPQQGGMTPEQLQMAMAQKFGQPQQGAVPNPATPAQPILGQNAQPTPAPSAPAGMPAIPSNSKPYLPTGGAVPPAQAAAPVLNKAASTGAGVSKEYPVNQSPI